MNTKRAAHLAAIALFTTGGTRPVVVDRIVLTTEDGREMGGWSFSNARRQIAEAIEQAIAEAKPKRKRVKK